MDVVLEFEWRIHWIWIDNQPRVPFERAHRLIDCILLKSTTGNVFENDRHLPIMNIPTFSWTKAYFLRGSILLIFLIACESSLSITSESFFTCGPIIYHSIPSIIKWNRFQRIYRDPGIKCCWIIGSISNNSILFLDKIDIFIEDIDTIKSRFDIRF